MSWHESMQFCQKGEIPQKLGFGSDESNSLGRPVSGHIFLNLFIYIVDFVTGFSFLVQKKASGRAL